MNKLPVLLVDDDASFLEWTRERFADLGVTKVFTSTSVAEASSIVAREGNRFEAIIVDLDLTPNDTESGVAFLEQIATDFGKQPPFFLLTDHAIGSSLNDRLRNLDVTVIDKAALAWTDLLRPADINSEATAAEAIDAAVVRRSIDRRVRSIARGRQFHSSFISYSSKDARFATKLYADLQAAGVDCWFAPESMNMGDLLRPSIDRAIREFEKVILVLSRNSLGSQWVEQEVEKALEQERRLREEGIDNQPIVIPIRIDDAVFSTDVAWAAYLRNTRNVGGFEDRDYEGYAKSLERLLRALRR